MAKIKKKSILDFIITFILFFPYLQPASYCLGTTFTTFLGLWLRGTWFVAIIILLKNRSLSITSICFILFQFCFLWATILNTNYGEISSALYIFCNNFSIVILSEYFIKKDSKSFIKNLLIIYIPLILLNFISMYMYYPLGMYTDILGDHNYYFLEHDNGSFFYTLAVIYLSFCYNISNRKNLFLPYFLLIVSFLTYYYIFSATAFICLGIIILLLILYRSKLLNKLISSNLFYIIFIISLLVLLSFCQPNSKINVFANILKNLGKDATLSGRTSIWLSAINFIKYNLFFGYGQEYLNIRLLKFGVSHVHNILLQIVYNGGLISLVLYILYFKKINKNINKCKNFKLVYVSKIFIYMYFVASLFDYYNTKYIINLIFIVSTFLSFIDGGSKNERLN